MKKMRHSDEHKKRWFLLSVVDLSYYKSYQVRVEREGGRGKNIISLSFQHMCQSDKSFYL